MRPDLPSGTVTFLFTDVEGSTRLLHELGAEAYAEALAEHRRVIREACVAEDGVEVDTQGDAFFFAFPTAPGALAAAAAFSGTLDDGPIRVRVGLHTGTPLLTGEGYVGDDVHLAARMASSAHGGQVVISAATTSLLEPNDGVLPERAADPLPLRGLGEHRLKDIAEPVSIYQLGDGRFPPLKTISNTNLPRPASSFVGREEELEEALSRIERGARLLTLTGPGGTGKTRLALEAALTLVPQYKAGVFWVGLASLRDRTLVTETIAQTLGAKEGLAEHIGEREMLLLLDNLEQVVECAPELSGLLQACPNLNLLCTSRELLRIQGEVEYPVPPLATLEAVELFCARAQLEPTPDIAELCARLDSLPLAVELAAARTRALTPSQILARLSQRLDLLQGGRDADPRQQTLRATIEWSYDLLSPEEQRLFARLSVFVGGCTLEAAEEVCDADPDTLQSLVEKSLLRFTPAGTGGRYWMLETIREYAGELLTGSGEEDQIVGRHARHYLQVAEQSEPRLHGSDQVKTLQLLDVERDNFRQALFSLRDPGAATAMLRLAGALARFWYMRGYIVEGREWLDEALAESSSSAVHRAKALWGLSILLDSAGRFEESRERAEASVLLYRELGSEGEGLADALNHLGNALTNLGMFERSEAVHQEALAISKTLDSPYRIGRSLSSLSALSLALHDYDRTLALTQEALPYCRDARSAQLECVTLGNRASAMIGLGRPDDAVPPLRASLALSRDLRMVEFGVCGLTTIAALRARGEAFRSAMLLGCAEGLCEQSEIVLPRFESELFDVTARELEERLGPESLLAARIEGRRRDFDEAVDYALETIDRAYS